MSKISDRELIENMRNHHIQQMPAVTHDGERMDVYLTGTFLATSLEAALDRIAELEDALKKNTGDKLLQDMYLGGPIQLNLRLSAAQAREKIAVEALETIKAVLPHVIGGTGKGGHSLSTAKEALTKIEAMKGQQ